MNRTAPQADFDLQIGELVIDGFSPAESKAIAAALELELGRLLADGPMPFGDGRPAGPRRYVAFDRADAGTIQPAANGSPQALGRSAARAVVRQLRRLSSRAEAPSSRRAQP